MIIKKLTKKVIISTVMASSLFVLPQFTPHHAAHAATATINTTHQILKVGNRGSAVKSVQTRLTELGFFHSSIDGDYGPLTRGAVVNFQKANHLSPDGVAGPHTLSKLFGTSSTAATRRPTIKVKTASVSTPSSSTSTSTKSLQSKLRSLGYYHDTVDGVYGPNTRNAVRAFQAANHLVVDGVAGKNTWAKLNSSTAVAASAASTTTPKTINLSTASTSSSLVSNIVSDAKALEGIRYRYGGTTTSGFDCSGFTQYVFRENGISLPRTAAQQYAQGSSTALVPGALVFFSSNGSSITHVGIYIGNNDFIEASSTQGITIASMSNPYWAPKYVGARTYINFQS